MLPVKSLTTMYIGTAQARVLIGMCTLITMNLNNNDTLHVGPHGMPRLSLTPTLLLPRLSSPKTTPSANQSTCRRSIKQLCEIAAV